MFGSARQWALVASSVMVLAGGTASAATADVSAADINPPTATQLGEPAQAIADRLAAPTSVAMLQAQLTRGPASCRSNRGAAPTLVRHAGSNRYLTAVCISAWTWPAHNDSAAAANSKAKAVVLAQGEDFPDALAGAPLAAHAEGPLLLTTAAALVPEVKAEIQAVLAPGGLVYLLGGTSSLSAGIQTELQTAGFTTRRLAGANRFETAVAVAEELPDTSNFFFVTGRNFPDALGAGTAAAAMSLAAKLDTDPSTRPVALLMTDDAAMPTATLNFVNTRDQQLNGSTLLTAGSTADQAAVAAFGASNLTARYAGSNRYQTAALIAEGTFTDQAGNLIGIGAGLTTDVEFANGVSATASLARLGQPLLLTEQAQLSAATSDFLLDHAGQGEIVDIFGGATTISDAIADQAAAAIAP